MKAASSRSATSRFNGFLNALRRGKVNAHLSIIRHKVLRLAFAATCALTSLGTMSPAAYAQASTPTTPAATSDMSGMSGMAGMPGMSGMHKASPKSSATAGAPASRAFRAADQKMMKDMSAPYTGNADQDFVAHMIPHHRGAVDMAQVELKYGTDPVLRKLAASIVRDQQEEIALMSKWQNQHPAQ